MSGDERDLIIALFKNKWRKWDTLKPPKSHHCSTCKACIARMDHHCPWVNNWIGINNQKAFLLFCFYIFFGSVYSLSILFYYTHHCLYDQCQQFLDPISILLNVGGIFMGVLFGTFTAIMLFEQISCIINETSTIDKLKKTLNKAVFLH